MRTFGVEEELLVVEATSLEPVSVGDWAADLQPRVCATGHRVSAELQQEQIEIISPPQTTLAEQLETIRAGRVVAEQAAAKVGGRVVALATSPAGTVPHMVPDSRFYRIGQQFGVTATENLTNGFHIHVGVASRQEAVTALDRIRIWLPVLLALSANSPFWQGRDTGYASYRHRVLSRWPVSGPTDVFGSVRAYDRHRTRLLNSAVPLDAAMFYYDARPSERQPTLEVRIADVCLDPTAAAVIAALARALVETAIREGHRPAPEVPASLLRSWSWMASRSGIEDRLIDPTRETPASAGDVISRLLDLVRPVLADYGEEGPVQAVVARILRHGTGAQTQRHAYAARQEFRDVVAAALDATHRASSLPSGA
jgi:glutamate---cysteine ligase / carboxylate-amine ligase